MLHLDMKIEDGILVFKLFDKREKFRFSWTAYHTELWFYISRISSYSQMYTETKAFSTKSLGSSFKYVFPKGKSKLYQ